jgi:hypothetical protein
MQAIEFKIRQRESRTGITRLNKGVDEDTLNDTAKGQAQLMSRGQQMERYIIRNFAEGVARLFMKKVGLMRKYAQPFQIRVDGQYRQVDPSQWPEDLEVQRQGRPGLGVQGRPDHGPADAWPDPGDAQAIRLADRHRRQHLQQRDRLGAGFGLAPNDCSPSRPRTSRATRFRNSSRPIPRCRR